MSRRSIPLVMLATLTVLTVVALVVSVSQSAGHQNPFGAPLYGFGGYRIHQPTTEIGAQWRVPAIDPSSPPHSAASTWIAVANSQRQFIQVGTVEITYGAIAEYAVFWSDVKVGFHPQFVGIAHSGNLIKFKMVQTSRGWRLDFNNVTIHAYPRTIVVPYGQGSTFDSAQWIQEDPTEGDVSDHVPYPTMVAPTFRHVTLNGATPRLREKDGLVLATANGVILVPTPVHHGQFTLTGATGPARQYLTDFFAYDVALYPFQLDTFHSRSPSKAVLRRIRTTLSTIGTELRTQTWPATEMSAVKGDERYVSDYQKLFAHYSVAPAPLNAAELTALRSDNRRDKRYVIRIRHALGLPPA